MSYPKIVKVSLALPEHKVNQKIAREWARERFSSAFKDIDRLVDVFDNSGIENRYFCVPPEWFSGDDKSFQEKNDTYIEHATLLSNSAISSCLNSTEIGAGDVDYLIFVSTTGLATPSIDARLIGSVDMNPHIRRTPIWGLGCAGGAAGLSHAYHYILGHPKARVMLVALELCGLTFHFQDMSKSNLVATALFGDGCAAVLVTGEEVEDGLEGPIILGTQSTLWPDSLKVMGWNIYNEGMQVVFSRAIPVIVRKMAKENIEVFLKQHDLRLEDIDHFIAHPGGTKVLDAYEEALNLRPGLTDVSRKILSEYGNVSSVTVLMVLERFMRSGMTQKGDLGLVTALGPGFSSEHMLVRF